MGTSGWHYPHWVGPFYPSGMASEEFLRFYARHFSGVEIKNTFYHLPAPHTVAEWKTETPKNFLSTCKGSRYITHMGKAYRSRADPPTFFETVNRLSNKWGRSCFSCRRAGG